MSLRRKGGQDTQKGRTQDKNSKSRSASPARGNPKESAAEAGHEAASPHGDPQIRSQLATQDNEEWSLRWFTFETRIRKIVYELLNHPMETVKKMIDRQEVVEDTISRNKRRIDEHDFLLYKFQKRTDMEEEYEARITKVETEVKTQLAKNQASMADLTTKVNLCEKKEIANGDQINKLDARMDTYLSKLKDDVDHIAGQNIKLFSQFMESVKEVDDNYQEHSKRMRKQQEFFEENKERYRENLLQMERMTAQIRKSEAMADGHARAIREEVDALDARINDKDRQNNDMLRQVVGVEERMLEVARKTDELLQRVKEAKKFTQVVQPFETAHMLFDCMHKACQGSQFNRVRDFEAKCYEKLRGEFEEFQDSDTDQQQWFPDSYSIPELPAAKEEEKPAPLERPVGSSAHSSILNLGRPGGSFGTGLSGSVSGMPPRTSGAVSRAGAARRREQSQVIAGGVEEGAAHTSKASNPEAEGSIRGSSGSAGASVRMKAEDGRSQATGKTGSRGSHLNPPSEGQDGKKSRRSNASARRCSISSKPASAMAREDEPLPFRQKGQTKKPDMLATGPVKRPGEPNDNIEGQEILVSQSQNQTDKSGEDAESVVNVLPDATACPFSEEQLRELILDYRERWLEEDEEKQLRMCREVSEETCYLVLDEQLESQVHVKQLEQDEAIRQLAGDLEALGSRGQESDERATATGDRLQAMLQREQEKLHQQLTYQARGIEESFGEIREEVRAVQAKFLADIKEAFGNFKVSTELEQTKRMRQIGDFVATQHRLLGQISFNEKNYQIFQKTSEQICDQIANLLQLIGLQNSLAFQEEKDKNTISLHGSAEPEVTPADIGGRADERANEFVKKGPPQNPSALSFKTNLLASGSGAGAGQDGAPGADSRAHVELEKRCQVCGQDGNSRHNVVKAMKIACLKYRSGKVQHSGQWYDRMKLIKIQEDLLQQHSLQIKAIVGGKHAMEKSRDLVKDGKVTQYVIRLQEYGISLENDEPVVIGRKVLDRGEGFGESKFPGDGATPDEFGTSSLSALNARMHAQPEESRLGGPGAAQRYRAEPANRDRGSGKSMRESSHDSLDGLLHTSKNSPRWTKDTLDRGHLQVISHRKASLHPVLQEHLQDSTAAKDQKKFDCEVFINTGQREERESPRDSKELRAAGAKDLIDLKIPGAPGEPRSRDPASVELASDTLHQIDHLKEGSQGPKVREAEWKSASSSASSPSSIKKINIAARQGLAQGQKEEFLHLKNQKLTGHDGDSNLRQENLDILKMKKQALDQQRESQAVQGIAGSSSKPRTSKPSDFRMPDIDRILQNGQIDQKVGESLVPKGTDPRMHSEAGRDSLKSSLLAGDAGYQPQVNQGQTGIGASGLGLGKENSPARHHLQEPHLLIPGQSPDSPLPNLKSGDMDQPYGRARKSGAGMPQNQKRQSLMTVGLQQNVHFKNQSTDAIKNLGSQSRDWGQEASSKNAYHDYLAGGQAAKSTAGFPNRRLPNQAERRPSSQSAQNAQAGLKSISGQPKGQQAPYATYSSTAYDFNKRQVLAAPNAAGYTGLSQQDASKKRPSTTLGTEMRSRGEGAQGNGYSTAVNGSNANTTAPPAISGQALVGVPRRARGPPDSAGSSTVAAQTKPAALAQRMDSRDAAAAVGSGRGSTLNAAGGSVMNFKNQSSDIYGLNQSAQPHQAPRAAHGTHSGRQAVSLNRQNPGSTLE